MVFAESSDYRRLMVVIHGIAGWLLINSGLVVFGQFVAGLCLLISLMRVIRHPKPYKNLCKLEYVQQEWCLLTADGSTERYSSHHVLAELGLFFLLQLSASSQQKTIVVFFDQISSENYRCLRLLETIQ